MSTDRLANLDLYSEPIHFFYRRNKYYKTIWGGILSLITFLALLAYLGYLFMVMILRQYPIINNKIFVDDEPRPVSVAYDISYDFPNKTRDWIPDSDIDKRGYWYISFGVRDNDPKLAYPPLIKLEDSYLTFAVNQISKINGTLVKNPLNYALCPKFGQFDPSIFNNLVLNMTYCINDNYDLIGTQGNEGSSWLEVRFTKCAGKPFCSNRTTLDAWLMNLQLEFYFQNSIINTTAFIPNIVVSAVEEQYWDLVPTFTKIADVELGIDYLDSYDSYLPDFINRSYNRSYSFMVRSFETQISDLNSQNDILIVNFMPSRTRYATERRYVDILTQLALVGGITSILFSLGYLVVFFALDSGLMRV